MSFLFRNISLYLLALTYSHCWKCLSIFASLLHVLLNCLVVECNYQQKNSIRSCTNNILWWIFQLLNIPQDKRVNRLRKVRLLLESSQMKLDDAIMLFHDFWVLKQAMLPFPWVMGGMWCSTISVYQFCRSSWPCRDFKCS